MAFHVSRRTFLAATAATAVIGASRKVWAADEVAVPKQAAPADVWDWNDYCVAEISTAAVKNNLALIRRELKPTTKLCSVVKTDCYHHGWEQCKDAILAEADWLAVAKAEEALIVRRSGAKQPILVLMACGFPGDAARERLRQLIANDITLTVASPTDVEAVSAVATQMGRKANVHMKIDTGMTRSGILADRAPALIHKARHQPGVALTGLYTHYPVADMLDKTFTHQQLALFLDTVKKAGSDAEGCILHTASSAPTINMPETHLDMVRVGLATYGYQPSDEDPKRLPLQPILRLVCKLGQVKDVPAGTRIGYGLTYRFERDSKVGLIQIGYGDGYCRGFSNRAVMKVAGRYVPVRGRVSMDQATIDLTDVPDAKIGDEVEVISSDPKAPNSLENLARLIDTIPAVIASGLGYRIRRVTVA